MMKRVAGLPWVVPAVLHWKMGHFAPITRYQDGLYLVKDSTYGKELWGSPAVLDAETTGYLLADSKDLPGGWMAVSKPQKTKVLSLTD